MEEEYTRKFMVEQPKNNISELQLEEFLTPSIFSYWKANFKTEVFSGSLSLPEFFKPC